MTNEIVTEVPRIVHDINDDFPVIDFKFASEGRAGTMLWKFEIDIMSASVDCTPVMEYSLGVAEKALVAHIVNYGWGPCVNLNMSVDLGIRFGDSLKRDPVARWTGDVDESVAVKLITIDDIDFLQAPQSLKLTEDDSRLSVSYQNQDIFWGAQKYIASHGIGSLPAEIEYEDIEGKVYKDKQSIHRIQRGVYDWGSIYLFPDGFREVPYDGGMRYCLMRPTCFYNVMLEPTREQQTRSFNISHVVGSSDFERFFIVLGSKVSAKYALRFRFYVDNGQILESQFFAVHIWNPKNSVFHRSVISEEQEPISIGPSQSATRSSGRHW